MTTEQKAKAYDEALKWMRDLYPNMGIAAKKKAESIFKELAESKDENIRKAILELVRQSSEILDKQNQNNMIAWLEKQAEVESDKDDIEAEEKDIRKAFNKIWDEKQGEQKSSDKEEPRFHEMDWVVYKNDICQIVKREEGCNKLVTVFGIEKELVNERNLSTARLWTIQDAKAGDVLAAHECYVIFKEIDGLNIKCYCTYHYMNNPSFHVDTLHNKDAFHPATKEQRDLLFQKMKEAGYTFDFEKKELNHIEQNLEMVEALRTEYEKGRADAIAEIQKEWGEEDEKMIGRIRSIIEAYAFSQSAVDVNGDLCEKKFIDVDIWLKSFKDKYTWKPSEKQMNAFEQVYDWYNNDFAPSETLTSLYNDLKKLKEE